MIYISTLSSPIKEYELYSNIYLPALTDVRQIKMLTKDVASENVSECIYFSDVEHIKEVLEANMELRDKTIFVAAPNHDLEIPQDCSRLNYLIYGCDISLLFNSLSDSIRKLRIIDRSLHGVPVNSTHLQGLLNTALSNIDVPSSIVVVSPTFQVLDASYRLMNMTAAYINNVAINSYLNHNQIMRCLGFCSNISEDFVFKKAETVNITIPINNNNGLIGYIVFWAQQECFGLREILIHLSNMVPMFIAEEPDENSSVSKEFAKVAEYVLLSSDLDVTTLEKNIESCPDRLDIFIRTILINYDSNKMSLQNSITELREIFHTNNVCLLDNRLLVWVSGKSHIERPSFDEVRFDTFLKDNQSFAIISNSAHYKVGLQTLYTQAKEMLDIIDSMPYILAGKNFVYFNDIIQMYLIYLCSNHLTDHYGHNRLTYLAGPEIMGIIQDDAIHGTNNLEFLYSYISCGCNVQETSKKMHMHRNTVHNHLKTISDLIGEDISDPRISNKLSISCSIMLFATRTLRQENKIIIGKKELEVKGISIKPITYSIK